MAEGAQEVKGHVLLFRGIGAISAMIRWQTRGPYSHAALLYPDGRRIIEAWHTGVRSKLLTSWAGVDAFEVPGIHDWTTVFAFAEAQLGKRYDFVSVLRFLDRARAKDNQKWFCSELVYSALATQLRVLSRIDAANVSPTHLSWSPFLVRVK